MPRSETRSLWQSVRSGEIFNWDREKLLSELEYRPGPGKVPDLGDDIKAFHWGLVEHWQHEPQGISLGAWVHHYNPFSSIKNGTREVLKIHEGADDFWDGSYAGAFTLSVGSSVILGVTGALSVMAGSALFVGAAIPVLPHGLYEQYQLGRDLDILQAASEVPFYQDVYGFYQFFEGLGGIVGIPLGGLGVSAFNAILGTHTSLFGQEWTDYYLEFLGERILGYDPHSDVKGDNWATVAGNTLAMGIFIRGGKGKGIRVRSDGSIPKVKSRNAPLEPEGIGEAFWEKADQLLGEDTFKPPGTPVFHLKAWENYSVKELLSKAHASSFPRLELLRRIREGSSNGLLEALVAMDKKLLLKKILLPELKNLDLKKIVEKANEGDVPSQQALQQLAKHRPEVEKLMLERADTRPSNPGDKL